MTKQNNEKIMEEIKLLCERAKDNELVLTVIPSNYYEYLNRTLVEKFNEEEPRYSEKYLDEVKENLRENYKRDLKSEIEFYCAFGIFIGFIIFFLIFLIVK